MRGTDLVIEEREIISRGIVADLSFRAIGKLLNRDHSVVSREVARNGGRSAYRAIPAQQRSDEHRARSKPRLLELNTALHDAVNSGLEKKWLPKQISKRLREDYPDDDTMRVSHETIYQSLYLQARGELRTQLTIALRQGRTRRVSRSRTAVARGKIRDMVNISERPVEAEDRAVPGFWEGDLIIGKGGRSQIATLVERTSRFTILVRIPYGRTAERVSILLAQKMENLPEFLRKSVSKHSRGRPDDWLQRREGRIAVGAARKGGPYRDHRFAAAICQILERGRVEAVDILELAVDLIPLVSLDRLGLDKEAFASEILVGIKKLPRPTELIDLMRSLFNR